MARSRILCVGAAHWDLVARSDGVLNLGDDVPGRIEQRPGGVALNVSLGLAKHGVAASLCSVVGGDEAGASLIRHAEVAGVDCADVLRIKGAATSRYMAIENNDGKLVAAVADVGPLETHAPKVVEQTQRTVTNADTLFLDANLPEAAISEIAERTAARGIEVVANPVSPAKAARLVTLMSGSRSPTLITNLDEANALLRNPATNTPDAASALVANGAGIALVTDGARPAALATGDRVVTMAPPDLDGPVSVTGAGDALLAAYLAFPERQSNPEAALAGALQAAAKHMKMR